MGGERLQSRAREQTREAGAPARASDCLEGVTVVITGVLDSLERDEAEDFIRRHGGKVTGSVSGRTSYVLVGMDCGQSKIKKAREHGTALMDEDGLFAMVQMRAHDGGGVGEKTTEEVPKARGAEGGGAPRRRRRRRRARRRPPAARRFRRRALAAAKAEDPSPCG